MCTSFGQWEKKNLGVDLVRGLMSRTSVVKRSRFKFSVTGLLNFNLIVFKKKFWAIKDSSVVKGIPRG